MEAVQTNLLEKKSSIYGDKSGRFDIFHFNAPVGDLGGGLGSVFRNGYFLEYGVWTKCKFYVKQSSNANVEEFHRICRLAERVNTFYLLVPESIGSTTGEGSPFVALAYRFHRLFVNDPKFKPRHLFPPGNRGMMDEWWLAQAKNLYQTLEHIHDCDVAHGKLCMDESYAIRNRHLNVLNPTIDMSGLSENVKDLYKRADMIDSGTFLSRRGIHGTSKDWIAFKKMLRHGTINEVQNHPALKTAVEKFNLRRFVYDNCILRWNRPKIEWLAFRKKLKTSTPLVFLDWIPLVPPGTNYFLILHNAPGYIKKYASNDFIDLLRYIKNVQKHINDLSN